MPARPGKIQATFSAGEVDPALDSRTEQKAYNGGLRWAENIEFVPQGGFRLAPRPRHLADLPASASRLLSFTSHTGDAYDIVLHAGGAGVFDATHQTAALTLPYGSTEVAEIDVTQQLDTALIFHPSHAPRRLLCRDATTWTVDLAPFTDVPNWDYGGTYTNGVAAVWEIELVGVATDTVFTLTISKQPTTSLRRGADAAATAAAILAAILALPNVAAGVTVESLSTDKYRITFAGSGNTGDGWAVSGEVVNKADAAIVSFKTTVGVEPGEPIMSETRGWPATGAFAQQRLLIGGFKSLPNAWGFSIEGQYFNFDQRLKEANGSAIVPMDIDGGERIQHFFNGRNLCIFTSAAEYWLSERAISKTTVPNHVQSSSYGSLAGVQPVESEGAALFVQADRGVVGEFRYTDVNGNFETIGISLVAAHLFHDLTGHAVQRSATKGKANRHFVIRSDGSMITGTLLRQQEITAYGRWSTDGSVFSVAVNGRNEATIVVERSRGEGVARTIERLDATNLLDGAVTVTSATPSTAIVGLAIHEGAEVWAIADDDVFGPLTVSGGAIELPRAVTTATVGRWSPPIAETLPLSRLVSAGIWVQRKARIHTVRLSVEDTTSIAVAANLPPRDPDASPLTVAAGRVFDVPLKRWGAAADVGELAAPVTGWVSMTDLRGFVDEPTVVVTQVRPGRLNVKAIILEATIGG